MARQGKLHSSPYHVETAQYMYAIEHDPDSQYNSKEIPDCDFINHSKLLCNKWNSGYNKCTSYRCKYYLTEQRRTATCRSCAYCYADKCFHNRKPTQKELNVKEAEYCCYYFPRESSIEKYRYIRKCCARFHYTKLINECRKHINSKNKYIKQAKFDISKSTTSEQEREYLTNKILQKEKERATHEKELQNYRSKLNALGGELEELPWFENKKNHRKKAHNQKTRSK